jgi:hypothetical protein
VDDIQLVSVVQVIPLQYRGLVVVVMEEQAVQVPPTQFKSVPHPESEVQV